MTAFLFRSLTRKAGDQRGIVLVVTVLCLVVVGLLGATAVTMSSTDLWLAGAFKSSQIALHNAQAGVHYALSHVVLASDPDVFLSHDFPPLDRVFADQVFQAAPPAGFAFEIDRQHSASITDRRYVMRVIGRATVNSPIRRIIEVVVERRSALKYGLFATARLDLPATGGLFSYDSRLTHRPLPELSTGDVQIGSNGEVTAESSQLELRLDGIVGLGKDDDGTQATFAYREPSPDVPLPPVVIPQGRDQEIELVAENAIEADPLDANRLVEKAEQRFQLDNRNADIGSIEDDRLTSSTRLREGDYYFDELHLDAGGTLLIDARRANVNIYTKAISLAGGSALTIRTDSAHAGYVNIYLDGPAAFGTPEPSRLPKPTVLIEGRATALRIFSRSSEPIDFYHHGDFKGLVYAPYAPVTVSNATGKGYGTVWGQTVNLQHNDLPYIFFVDTAPSEQFLSRAIDILSWKEVQP